MTVEVGVVIILMDIYNKNNVAHPRGVSSVVAALAATAEVSFFFS